MYAAGAHGRRNSYPHPNAPVIDLESAERYTLLCAHRHTLTFHPPRPAGDGLIAEGRVLFFGMALQRGYGEGTLSSITYFPGARFIIAGMLSRPHSYYKVGEAWSSYVIVFAAHFVLAISFIRGSSTILERFYRPTARP